MQSNLKQITKLRQKFEAEKLRIEMNNDFLKPHGNNYNWFNENSINNNMNSPIKNYYNHSPLNQNFIGKEDQIYREKEEPQKFDESPKRLRIKPLKFEDEKHLQFQSPSKQNEELPLPLMSNSMIMPVFSDLESIKKKDDKYLALLRKQKALEKEKESKDEEILNLKKMLLEKQSNSKPSSDPEPLFKSCISEDFTFDPNSSKSPFNFISEKNAIKPDQLLISEEEVIKKAVYPKKNGFATSCFSKNSSDSRNNTPVAVARKVEKKTVGVNSNNTNNNNLNEKNTPNESLNSMKSIDFERRNNLSSRKGEGKKQFNFCRLKNSEAKIESSISLAVINIKKY